MRALTELSARPGQKCSLGGELDERVYSHDQVYRRVRGFGIPSPTASMYILVFSVIHLFNALNIRGGQGGSRAACDDNVMPGRTGCGKPHTFLCRYYTFTTHGSQDAIGSHPRCDGPEDRRPAFAELLYCTVVSTLRRTLLRCRTSAIRMHHRSKVNVGRKEAIGISCLDMRTSASIVLHKCIQVGGTHP